MTDFPKCMLIVTAEVDPAVEKDWNHWYNTVHLPDALKCPGVLHGKRYVSAGDVTKTTAGETRRSPRRIYTTIYELSGPAVVDTPEFKAMRGWYQFAPHVISRTQVVLAQS